MNSHTPPMKMNEHCENENANEQEKVFVCCSSTVATAAASAASTAVRFNSVALQIGFFRLPEKERRTQHPSTKTFLSIELDMYIPLALVFTHNAKQSNLLRVKECRTKPNRDTIEDDDCVCMCFCIEKPKNEQKATTR